ncbi:MAG TPA: hypothetical protein VJ717_07995 [Gemmatimonadaceae bacterium]|nr:hypothetical protein [Gemmatimonadaceae bacterium]
MNKRRPTEPDAEVLREPAASRLLARASELDAAQRAGLTVAELRAAATEAGISPYAFEAALTELRDDGQVPASVAAPPARRPRRWAVFGLAALMALSTLFFARRVVPVEADAAAVPTVEEAFLLRCISTEQAAELVRPLLTLPANTVVHSPRAPQVLTIRATPQQMQNVRVLLDRYEGAGSPSCPTTPPPTR